MISTPRSCCAAWDRCCAMMPLNQASMAAVPREEAGDAAGLYNMARNLGGSVGLALLGIFIDRRDSYHDAVIRESVTANSPIGQEHMSASAAGFFAQHGDSAYANMQALGQLAADPPTGRGHDLLGNLLRARRRAAAVHSACVLSEETGCRARRRQDIENNMKSLNTVRCLGLASRGRRAGACRLHGGARLSRRTASRPAGGASRRLQSGAAGHHVDGAGGRLMVAGIERPATQRVDRQRAQEQP